ncbi:MAG: hypothetical protein KA052_00150 [Candidatus Pacebacteria bacterium]|nr:hypothetical protein [Candidatus Paceibacterota bacterium]
MSIADIAVPDYISQSEFVKPFYGFEARVLPARKEGYPTDEAMRTILNTIRAENPEKVLIPLSVHGAYRIGLHLRRELGVDNQTRIVLYGPGARDEKLTPASAAIWLNLGMKVLNKMKEPGVCIVHSEDDIQIIPIGT